MPASHLSSPWTRWLIAANVVAIVLLVGRFAWPTPYRWERVNGALLRIERTTGHADVFDVDRGWVAVPEPRNPFDDLPDIVTGSQPVASPPR